MTTAPTKAALAGQVERLEATRGRLADRVRSLTVMLERAEEDRDRALMQLATCAAENARRRQLLMEARAMITSLKGARL